MSDDLIGVAMAAHQGFSANLFTLVSDTMPRAAVASAVGLGGGISAVAGAFSAAVIGRVLDATGGNYTLVFFACASVYVVATAIIHFLLPRRRSVLVAGAEPVAEGGYAAALLLDGWAVLEREELRAA